MALFEGLVGGLPFFVLFGQVELVPVATEGPKAWPDLEDFRTRLHNTADGGKGCFSAPLAVLDLHHFLVELCERRLAPEQFERLNDSFILSHRSDLFLCRLRALNPVWHRRLLR